MNEQRQEQNDDAISRKELLKIYENRFCKLQKLKHLRDNKGVEDRQLGINYCINILKEIPSVTPQPCEDVISRQAALEGIRNLYPDIPIVNIMGARRKWLEKYAPYFECENVVEQLPSAIPQQRTGRWIPVGYDGYADGNPVYDWWECSKCGWEHSGDEESLTAFCPNCGMKMEVEE